MAVALVRHGENGDWFASVGLQVSGSSTVSDMHICDRRIQVISKQDSHVVCRSWLFIWFQSAAFVCLTLLTFVTVSFGIQHLSRSMPPRHWGSSSAGARSDGLSRLAGLSIYSHSY